jgi:hypothetical protein
VLVVAFEGWNDAGEAATGLVRALRDALELRVIADVDPEEYFDYQFTRPLLATDDSEGRSIVWPGVTLLGPADPTPVELLTPERFAIDAPAVAVEETASVYLLLGTEPSRRWKLFTREVLELIDAERISSIVILGAMLADVPHTRPISVFVSSEDKHVRGQLELERSTYEGPVGITSVLADAAGQAGIPTVSIWASVPHYVHNSPSPKATLALLTRLEEVLGLVIPRGDLEAESSTWEAGIDSLAEEDEDMASYIEQLERARDAVDSPAASGDAIAEEFEKYLRRRGDGPEDDPRGR